MFLNPEADHLTTGLGFLDKNLPVPLVCLRKLPKFLTLPLFQFDIFGGESNQCGRLLVKKATILMSE